MHLTLGVSPQGGVPGHSVKPLLSLPLNTFLSVSLSQVNESPSCRQ